MEEVVKMRIIKPKVRGMPLALLRTGCLLSACSFTTLEEVISLSDTLFVSMIRYFLSDQMKRVSGVDYIQAKSIASFRTLILP